LKKLLLCLVLLCTQSVIASSEGTIDIFSDLTYNKSWSSKTRIIAPGKFKVKIKNYNKKLILKFKDRNGKRARIKIKTPRNMIPRRSGEFSISSLQTKQPFDISGSIDSTSSRSSSRHRIESCTYENVTRQCRINEHGRRICRTVVYKEKGTRNIYYHILHERINSEIQLYKPDSTDQIAHLDTFEAKNTMITEYRSKCHRY